MPATVKPKKSGTPFSGRSPASRWPSLMRLGCFYVVHRIRQLPPELMQDIRAGIAAREITDPNQRFEKFPRRPLRFAKRSNQPTECLPRFFRRRPYQSHAAAGQAFSQKTTAEPTLMLPRNGCTNTVRTSRPSSAPIWRPDSCPPKVWQPCSRPRRFTTPRMSIIATSHRPSCHNCSLHHCPFEVETLEPCPCEPRISMVSCRAMPSH